MEKDDNEDSVSENEEEYAQRKALEQRAILARFNGSEKAAAAAVQRARSSLVATYSAALVTCLAKDPARIVSRTVLSADERAACRGHDGLRRIETLFMGVHANLAQTAQCIGSPLEQRLWRGAARPPWPPLTASTSTSTSALTLPEAVQLLETHLGAIVAGVLVLPPVAGGGGGALAILCDWTNEYMPHIGLAVMWKLTGPLATTGLAAEATLVARHALPDRQTNPSAGAALLYWQSAWVPRAIVLSAAASTGVRPISSS